MIAADNIRKDKNITRCQATVNWRHRSLKSGTNRREKL